MRGKRPSQIVESLFQRRDQDLRPGLRTFPCRRIHHHLQHRRGRADSTLGPRKPEHTDAVARLNRTLHELWYPETGEALRQSSFYDKVFEMSSKVLPAR